MSLINKMLQDLDARGSHGASGMQAEVKPVAQAERRLPMAVMAIGAGLVVALIAAVGVLWMKRAPPVPVAPVVVALPVPAKARPVVPAQVAALTPVVAEPFKPVGPRKKFEPAPVSAPEMTAKPAKAVHASEPEAKPAKAVRASEPEAKPAKVVRASEPEPKPAKVVHASVPAAPVVGGRDMNDTQRSETLYRHALAALDEGRVAAAMVLLEQTLKLNPHHDAARQSLVALEIEGGHNDDAMRELEQGLALDPGQPALAMLLARMQIERGISGVPTLMRTLPSAAGNAEYHAFLAGALQREQRHKEAVAQYAAALRAAPDNGVWLMGMGISLQAEKRNAEAFDAFQRAKASATLTAPLLAFVERKIQQLTP